MNRRIVILGDDEYLSDEFDWEPIIALRAAGVRVDVVYTNDYGMDQGINAVLS